MIYVPGYGPSSAKIVVCGEAPGADEVDQLRPFVGASGRMVRDFIQKAGCNPDEVYYTNVVKVRPPDNDIRKLKYLGKTIEDYVPQLREEIHAINPNIVIAIGDTALKYTTGYSGITHYRGSLLQSCWGYPKVLPTIHPASILHKESEGVASWKDLVYLQWDFDRAIIQARTKELNLPKRNLLVCRSSLDLFRFLDRYKGHPYVSVDIETFKTIPICIAFAFNRHEAISVPLFSNLGFDIRHHELTHIWKCVADLLADPAILKIGQNFKFDELQLDKCLNRTVNFGLKTHGFFFDTMLAFRVLYPELKGKLEFITSVLTDEPYYKEEGKGYNPKKDKLDRLLLYNAKDAVVTYEIFEKELAELQERKLDEFFFTRMMPLHPFYSRLEGRGIKIDLPQRKALKDKYKTKLELMKFELGQLLIDLLGENHGYVLYGKKGNLSDKKVHKLLYVSLGIPLRAGAGEKILDALLRNVVKEEKRRRVIELILDIRKVSKTIGTYINFQTFSDGRARTGYRIILETGRTSTSVLRPPVTTEKMGLAFQTITKHGDVGSDLRSMYVPDVGKIFIEPDLSQAEDRVTSIFARDEKAILLFRYGIDRHRITAAWILDRAPDDLLRRFFENPSAELALSINQDLKSKIADHERQLGKMFRHACNLGMKKRTASENAGVSEWRAGQILDKVHQTNPNIVGVFHKEVQEFLRDHDRTLTNPFGRQRQFFNRWGDELFKEAYAFLNQSTVSDHLKFAMQRIEKRLFAERIFIEVLQESHDSFLAQIPDNEFAIKRTVEIGTEELQTPINFSTCSLSRGELIIPCDWKFSRKNWEEMEKVA